MGLLHEHQRPDRDHFIHVDCKAVRHYKEAEALVMLPKYARDWENEPELHQRMARVCSEPAQARKYLPMAEEMTRNQRSAGKAPEGSVFDPDVFDFGSIMIYGSIDLGDEEDVTRIPMARKFPPGYKPSIIGQRQDGSKFVWDAYFFQGGASTTADRRPSTMDIKRIAALYPGTHAQQNAAAALRPTDMWKPVHTSEMVDSSAWGHQILEAIGPQWIEPPIPDVVNKDLVPAVPPYRLWRKVFPWYCGEENANECVEVDMAETIPKVRCGEETDSCHAPICRAGEAGKTGHGTKSNENHVSRVV
ncbi:hypothetical protein LTR86_009096 [Recurvomyces mirabilis]|nr:hypothetical protein LTR86_009096 [Recurvomyces mirabilis]